MKRFISLFAVLLVAAAMLACGESTNTSTTNNTNSAPATANYPPQTEADLHGLAAKGDASAIHGFHNESVGLTGVCPQPKSEVIVDPSITGQQLAEDLLAYFYAQKLDNPCGSVVFAYHSQGEGDNGYTAGRILVDTTDSNEANITDPNATDVKYKITLDVGDVATGQEYVVTY